MRAAVEHHSELLLGTLEAVFPDQFPTLKKLVENNTKSLLKQLDAIKEDVESSSSSSSSSNSEEEEEEVEMKLEEDSSSSSSSEEEVPPKEEEDEDEEDVDFVVDDRAKLKKYDAKTYDKWVLEGLTKGMTFQRERKRIDRFDPSSSSSPEVHEVEVIADEGLCITKADRDSFAHFVANLHKDQDAYFSEFAAKNNFYRRRFGDALDVMINNTGFEHPKALSTVRTILDWACSDASDQVSVVTGVHNNSHSKCCFCNLPRECLAQVIVSQSRFPLGMSCMRICKAIIAFGNALWKADGTKDSLHLVDRAFNDIINAQASKNKKQKV